MLLSAVSVLVIALQSSEIAEGLMNNPVYTCRTHANVCTCIGARPTWFVFFPHPMEHHLHQLGCAHPTLETTVIPLALVQVP
jgi:hypothetical protein